MLLAHLLPEDPRQVVDVPAVPDVTDREEVSEDVRPDVCRPLIPRLAENAFTSL